MLDRTIGAFRYNGLPDTIPAKVLELYLQINGYLAFAQHKGELYAYTGGLGGEPDVYYRPTLFTVANPAQNFSANLRIGTECVVMKNDSLYMGLLPLYRRYAHALAENELSIFVSDVNSRMVNLISATDDRTIESAKRFIADIEAGRLGIVSDNAFLEGLKAQPLAGTAGRSNILDLIETEQYMRAQWYNEIGLDSNYNMKRERMNTAEVEANNDSLAPLIDDMLACRQEAIDEVNSMFGLSISVELAGAWERNRLEDELLLDEMLEKGTGSDDPGETDEEGGREDG